MGRATPLSTGKNEADRVEKRRRAFEQSPLVPRKTGTLILSGNVKNLKLQNRKNENVKTSGPNGQTRASDPSIDWEKRGEHNGDDKEDFQTFPIGTKENGDFGSKY
ncbi:hypothetical protein NPIL_71581 [Nephila pilipes]|uniref:Uncharacterized protein n=1 Tax=Nephila pilipes TaxID=299642 RepID=A0A8X6T5Z5_NEPPI|nr:hypothetical protein NPIL_71581 [Nephila pilipes]